MVTPFSGHSPTIRLPKAPSGDTILALLVPDVWQRAGYLVILLLLLVGLFLPVWLVGKKYE